MTTFTQVLLASLAGGLLGLALFWQLRSRAADDETSHPPGRPYPTRAGRWVASHGEQRIANRLHALGLAYAYEPELAGGLTPDFHLEGTDIVIEYWGLASEPAYEERMLEKIEQYESHGYRVVSLFPGHVHELEAVLDQELERVGAL